MAWYWLCALRGHPRRIVNRGHWVHHFSNQEKWFVTVACPCGHGGRTTRFTPSVSVGQPTPKEYEELYQVAIGKKDFR